MMMQNKLAPFYGESKSGVADPIDKASSFSVRYLLPNDHLRHYNFEHGRSDSNLQYHAQRRVDGRKPGNYKTNFLCRHFIIIKFNL